MIEASCHCGAVHFAVETAPDQVNDCNCSICRRYGALWAFYPREDVRLSGHPEHTTGYVWGERTIETFRCNGCGCVTHWEPFRPEATKLSVNMRNFDPAEIGQVRLRRFDGADKWEYLD